MDLLLTVTDNVFEASPNFGRKLVVESFDAFLPVTEDDSSASKVSS